jgi:putative ABC transport system permease protein
MQVQTSGQRFAPDSVRHRFFANALDAVRRVPGVTSAALTSQLPLSGDFDVYGVRFEKDDDLAADRGAHRYAVSPGYFETMRIPLRRGRLLDARDVAGVPVAVLINESLANRRFPGVDPIGQRLHVGRTDLPWYTVVGIVGDVKQASLAAEHPDAVYVTPSQWYFADAALWLVVRAAGDPAALAPAIERAVWSVDAQQPIVRTATLEQLLAASEARRRFALTVFQAFAVLALVLAAVGIHGVLSGSVSERTREIGIRSALGASRTSILAHVLRQGMTLTALGITVGLTGAVAASHALVSLLFGISRLDPVTYLLVIGLLTVVSIAACSVPAWRAARIDPAITLRAE